LVGALSFINSIFTIVVEGMAFARTLAVLQMVSATAILLAVAGMHFGGSPGRAGREQVT
jgi:hypothetical protein